MSFWAVLCWVIYFPGFTFDWILFHGLVRQSIIAWY